MDKEPNDSAYSSGSQVAMTTSRDEAKTEKAIFRYRVIKQISLVLVWISIGLFLEIVGSTLPDLKDLINTNYEEISQTLIFKSIGAIVGAPLGGVLCDKLSRHVDLLMSLSMMMAAAGTLCIPWFTVAGGISAMFFVCGIAEAVINTGGNTMCMKLWGEKSAAPMQSLHFGFGFGAILAPQLARPFLAQVLDANGTESNMSLTAATPLPIMSETRIQVAYLIVAVIVFAISLIVMVFYCVGPPKDFKIYDVKIGFLKVLNPAQCAQGSLSFGIIMLSFLFLFFIHVAGGERAYGKFLFAFATESEFENGTRFTRDEATELNSAFWASFTGGRFLGMILSIWIPASYMIVIEIIGALGCALVLTFIGYRQKLVLWIFTCAFGLFIAPVFPSGMAWANLYLNMTSMAVCILMLGAGTGGLIYQYLGGYLFDNVGPYSLFYMEIGYAVSLGIIFLILRCVAGRKGQRDFTDDGGEHTSDVTSGTEKTTYELNEITKEYVTMKNAFRSHC